MSLLDLEYALPTDDLKRITGSWQLVTGSTDLGYGLERLCNDDPAFPTKFSDATFRIARDYGAPVAPKYAALIHANLQPGYHSMVLQGHTSNVWTAPAFSVTFPTMEYQENGFPLNLGIDLREAAPSYRYWSLAATVANGVPIAIGLFIMVDTVRALDGHFLLSANPQDDEDAPSNRHVTDAGVESTLSFGTRLRWLRGEKLSETNEGAALLSWHRAAAGDAGRFLLLPHMEENEPWFARFASSKLPRTHRMPNNLLYGVRLEFAEISRGLKPTPSAV
jgi:hypothetical protein